MRRRGLAVLLVLEAVAASCGTVRRPESGVRLEPCHLAGFPEQVLCGTVSVAEDRTASGGCVIPLQVAVLPALRRDAAPDPLFLLAGGPGQGARSHARSDARFVRKVRRRRDVVLVDLRGTGGSRPLECPRAGDDLAGDLVPDVASCLRALAADPRLFTTEAAMRDLDDVRAALGYDRINLWGGSYGTREALVYAQLYPQHVRSVVLDGAVPFSHRYPLFVAEDALAALDRLAADCAREAGCESAFPHARADVTALLARLRHTPARATVAHPRTGERVSITLTSDSVAAALRSFLYVPGFARLVPAIVQRAFAGDFAPLLALQLQMAAASLDTMALGLTLSHVCSEDLPRITPEAAERATRDDFVGRGFLASWERMCADWPRGPQPAGADDVRPLSPPALLLSGSDDPVTPPRWGEAVARHFAESRHIVVPGAAHNVSFTGCVPDLIAAFVENGSGRDLDASCAAGNRRPPFVFTHAGAVP